MNRQIQVSVIVPVYRVEAYLPKCVDSILGQTLRDLEVILVDDGSPDNCGKICDEFAAADSRVRVIHKKNGGLSSARNAGIEIAQGAYIAFADSDDYLEPDAYASMLACAREQDVKLVCAGRYDEEAGVATLGLCPVRNEVVSGVELVRRIFSWEHIDSAAWDKLYARELFQEIRYPEGYVVEDVPTTYRIALEAGHAALLAKPVYHYIHREGSITTASVSEKTFHFSRHAAKVYADIRVRVPELEPQARYLWVRSLINTLIRLEQADAGAREQFSDNYSQMKKDLTTQLRFFLGHPLFDLQTKVTGVMICAGGYRSFRQVYHFLKCRKKETL